MKLAALSSKPRKWRVENSLLSYMLSVCLTSIPQDQQQFFVIPEWIQVLETDSVKPFEGMKSIDISSCAREVERFAAEVFRQAPASSYRELSLIICFLIAKLVLENRVDDVNCQGVLIANLILLEQAETDDWGSSKRSKMIADKLFDFVLAEHYFSCKLLHIR